MSLIFAAINPIWPTTLRRDFSMTGEIASNCIGRGDDWRIQQMDPRGKTAFVAATIFKTFTFLAIIATILCAATPILHNYTVYAAIALGISYSISAISSFVASLSLNLSDPQKKLRSRSFLERNKMIHTVLYEKASRINTDEYQPAYVTFKPWQGYSKESDS